MFFYFFVCFALLCYVFVFNVVVETGATISWKQTSWELVLDRRGT